MSNRLATILLGVLVLGTLVGCAAAGDAGNAANVDTPNADTAVDDVAQDVGAPDEELDGVVYGEGVSLTESVPVSVLYDNAEAYAGQRVRVEGLVTDVCEKRGCWIELAGDREFESIRVKVEDGVIVFPMSARGQYAVAEGILSKTEYTMEETIARMQHQADEHGEAFDPASVTEPLIDVRLEGIGAVIRGQP